MTKKMTIKDVAKAIGVSTATISNAFNRPDQLSETLRTRILAQCKELGYVGPSAAGRYLRTGRSGVVGVVLSDRLAHSMNDYVGSHFLPGLAEEFDKAHINMLLLSARDMDQSNRQRLHESMVDGFIVYGSVPSGKTLDHLLRQQKRLIVVDHFLKGYASINIDNRSSSRVITEHALKHNPKKIAIMGLRLNSDTEMKMVQEPDLDNLGLTLSIDRLNGTFDALDAAGIARPWNRIWNLPANDHNLASRAAFEALSSPDRPDLFICQSDVIAIATRAMATQMGIKIPDEIKIVGFDGIPQAQNFHPTITTIQQHSTEKGRMAAKLFIDGKTKDDVIMPTELLIGESCP